MGWADGLGWDHSEMMTSYRKMWMLETGEVLKKGCLLRSKNDHKCVEKQRSKKKDCCRLAVLQFWQP